LVELLRVIWQRRWWIVAITGICSAMGLAYALLATPFYRADVILMPRDNRAGYGLSAQLSQLGGLADLAGINVGAVDKQEPLGVLRSKGFARRFIEKNELLDTLVQINGPGGSKALSGDDGVPDIRRVVDGFVRSVMSVTEDKKSGLIVVSVVWKDPEVAAKWANQLVAQVNDEMRARAIAESESNIRYLTQQLQATNVVSIQQAISRLLEAEMQKSMLAKGTPEYAFRVIDIAEPPVQRQRPKRTLIVLVAFFSGLMLAVFAVIVAPPLRRIIVVARGAQ
jgi:uncharacterized protein involved in exopolysaccharide biosynthesis